jgi:phenylacetate-CoA ligase
MLFRSQKAHDGVLEIMNKPRKLVNQILASYYLSQLKRDQWKSPRELKNIQFKKLKVIIKHAYEHVPYYHRLFSATKTRPEDIRDQDDLRKIPLTSKQDLQKNYSCIVPRGINVSQFHSSFTSGSTGTPLKTIWDNRSLSFNFGSTMYKFSECGVKLSDNFVTVWGRAQSIVRLNEYVRLFGGIRETIVPLLTQEKLINVLRQMKPDVLNTFPSALSSLANYDVSGINPRLIFTQGEVVTQHCRDIVRKMFNLELLETYGSVEFGLLAFECNEHGGLHMITHGTYIEFVDEYGEYVSPGEQGEIIVTGLHNRAMPLIRYRIGDTGIPTDEKCACGRSWPLLRNVQGRINDYLVLPSGRKISWLHFYHQFYKELEKNVFSISQYQIIQDRQDRIIFKVVKGRQFDPYMLDRIKNNLERYFAELSENLEVVMEVVKEIPSERTGKRRILISKVIQ